MSDTVRVEGADKIEAKFREMGRKASTVYMKTALREGGGPIMQRSLQSAAPQRTGKLRQMIRVRAGTTKNDFVSVRVGFGKKPSLKNYGPWVDGGHFVGKKLAKDGIGGPDAKARYHARSVAAGRKFIEGEHFLHRGFDSGKEAAEEATVGKLRELIKADAP